MILLAAVVCAACGRRATSIDVLLVCPSADKSLVAVLWSEADGGAAGWTQMLLSIKPATANVDELVADSQYDPDVMLQLSDGGKRFELTWDRNDHLVVGVAYPDQSTVFSMKHQYPMSGAKQVRVSYRELEQTASAAAAISVKCESGAGRIENPPPRRIR